MPLRDPPPAPARGQPAGVGARRPLRRGGRGSPPSATPTSPPATPPPTRSRPCSTGSPPRPAAARCSACARATAGSIRPLLGVWRAATEAWCAEHGLPWREDPTNASRRVRPQPRPPRPRAGAARAAPGRRGERAAHASSCCATRPPCSTPRSTRRARRGRRPAGARSLRALPPALARLVCSGWRPAPPSATARRRSWRSPSTARSTSAEGCAPGSSGGRLRVRRRPRRGSAPRRLDCPARAPRRIHRRDPRAGRRAPAPGAPAGRGDHARLRGQGPAADRRAQGRRLLPLRPHAPHRGALRGRLHGRRVLRLEHPILRRGADPQGSRRRHRGPRRADRRGHRRLRPDALLPAAQPAGARSPPPSRCAPC